MPPTPLLLLIYTQINITVCLWFFFSLLIMHTQTHTHTPHTGGCFAGGGWGGAGIHFCSVCDSVARFSAGPERASMDKPQSGVVTLYSGCDLARTIWTPSRSRTPPTYADTNIVQPGGVMSTWSLLLTFSAPSDPRIGCRSPFRSRPSLLKRLPSRTGRTHLFTRGHVVSLTVLMSFQQGRRKKWEKR